MSNKTIKIFKYLPLLAILLSGLVMSSTSHALFGLFKKDKSSTYITEDAYKYFDSLGLNQSNLFIKGAIDNLDKSQLFLGSNDADIENFVFEKSIYSITSSSGAIKKYGQLDINKIAKACKANDNFITTPDTVSSDQVIYFVSTIRYYVCNRFISWNQSIEK